MLPPDTPPFGAFQSIGGRRLWCLHEGAGGPPVVFLPGAGMFGLGYHNVHREAAALGTSVLYDRAGTGWSEDAALPRPAHAVADELLALLDALGVGEPVVLVGHSLGGLYARRFAQRHPARVEGLLLLDPASEEYAAHLSDEARQFEAMMAAQPPMTYSEELVTAWRPVIEQMYAGWPDALRAANVARHLAPARALVGMHESRDVGPLYEEVRAGGALPAVPLLVFTATSIDAAQRMFCPEPVLQAQNAAKRAANESLARSVPGATHRVLDDASHAMFHLQRPDAVVAGLRELRGRIAARP